MPVTLVDHRFRDVTRRVAQSATCTCRRVHRPSPLRRPVHLVLIPVMESVLPAEPEPIQRMFENARFRLPFEAPWRGDSSVNRRIRSMCDVLQLPRQATRKEGAETTSGTRRIICTGRHTPRHKWAEVMNDSSMFRRQVVQPGLRVPKPDA